MYENVISKLHSAETIGIFMHINPDGDAVGSALALYNYLLNMGKEPAVFLEEGHIIRDNLAFLPGIDQINTSQIKHFDLSVALDCGAPGRIGSGAYKKFLKADDFACIDHHKESTQFVEALILEPKSAATCQILYKVLKEMGESYIDSKVATCLYSGIATDSGMLSFQNATHETYAVMAELTKYDISPYEINRFLFKNIKKSVFDLTNRALSNAKFYRNGEIGIIKFFAEDFEATGTTPPDTEGIINRVVDIIGVKVAITVAQNACEDGAYKVGIRSKDGIDSTKIASAFGGGGHVNASGCKIYDTPENVFEKLLKVANEVIDKAESQCSAD